MAKSRLDVWISELATEEAMAAGCLERHSNKHQIMCEDKSPLLLG